MPNKTKKESNVSSEQLNRRRSARLAGLDKEKPEESPRLRKKEPVKKKSKKGVSDKMSKGDVELDSSVENRNHNDKKENEEHDVSKDKVNDIEKEEANDEGGDFVVVKKSEIPSPSSNEVKEAIKAQGEDGELLVNYVQVTQDDVPDTKTVHSAVNGVCSNNNLETSKVEEPHQEVAEPKDSSV